MTTTPQPLSIRLSTWHPHHHETFSQGALLYFFSGSGELWTTRHSQEVESKRAYLIPHHSTVTMRSEETSSVMICTWQEWEIYTDQDQIVPMMNSEVMDALTTLLVQEVKQDKDDAKALRTLGELVKILYQRNQSDTVTFRAFKAASRECDMVQNYLMDHYQEAITLEQLAALIPMNKYSLAHLYQRTTGHSIMEELKRIRLFHAKEQLLIGNESIQTIAHSCGFTSAAYFIESFRRAYQITPLQYRKAQRRKKQ